LIVYNFGLDMLNNNCEQAGVFKFEVFIFHLPLCCIKLDKNAY
jgi:hypothetical protein